MIFQIAPNRIQYGWGEEHWYNYNEAPDFPERSYFFKILKTRFARQAHLGFNPNFQKQLFIDLIKNERDLIQRLLLILQDSEYANDKQHFESFRNNYIEWAMNNHNDFFLKEANDIAINLKSIRKKLMSMTHKLDFEELRDHIMLVPTGTIHSIRGLSLQSHPKENMPDKNKHTKNEAWIYLPNYNSNGSDSDWALLEVQEISNDTYSYADFYATFEWKDGRPQTRKPLLNDNELEEIIADGLYFEPKPRESYIKRAEIIFEKNGITLRRYIDDATLWPFFSVYEIFCHESGTFEMPFSKSTYDLFVANGSVEITATDKSYFLKAGESCIVHESFGKYSIESAQDTRIFVIGKPV